jgi:hypothetical protein
MATAIHSQSNYAPITLSGVIQEGAALVTTKLNVGFQFHMPCLTHEGTPTALSIATRPNVTINTILGLPFIHQTKMIINAFDQVADLRALDTPPFDINSWRTI